MLITDFLAESDVEREVLPGVEVDALLSLIGHPPTPAELVRVLGERPAAVLITWYEMFFDQATLAALSRAGVVGIVRAGVGFDNIDLVGARAALHTRCHAHRSSSNCMVGCCPFCLYPAVAGMHSGPARLWPCSQGMPWWLIPRVAL